MAERETTPQPHDMTALVGNLGKFAADTGRADLAKRLEQTRARLRDPDVRVIVVGEFKQGKSKLINALVNAPACPVDDDIATSVPTSVGYAEEASAWILVPDESAAPGPAGAPVARREVPLAELSDYVSERGNPGNERHIVSAEVLLPREILKGGLKLVDSPGVGGLDSSNALATLSALSSAHAVLLVSDASQEYTEPEVQFLKHAMRISPNVAAVLAKTDLYPEWRQIEQLDRGHLMDAGDVPMFSVSSDLRLLAAELQDRALNDESGFPALVAHLRREVLGRAELIHERGAVHDLVSVAEQLTVSLRSELNAMLHPEDTPRMIAQLEEAKARADEFRSRSARWQVTLTDGIADLIADMEHDLRDRLRKVQREAENSIDEGDPDPSGSRSPNGSTSVSPRRSPRRSSGPTSAPDGSLKRSPSSSARASPTSRRSTSVTRRASWTPWNTSRASMPGGWARGRRSTSGFAGRTAASSWSVWPPA